MIDPSSKKLKDEKKEFEINNFNSNDEDEIDENWDFYIYYEDDDLFDLDYRDGLDDNFK